MRQNKCFPKSPSGFWIKNPRLQLWWCCCCCCCCHWYCCWWWWLWWCLWLWLLLSSLSLFFAHAKYEVQKHWEKFPGTPENACYCWCFFCCMIWCYEHWWVFFLVKLKIRHLFVHLVKFLLCFGILHIAISRSGGLPESIEIRWSRCLDLKNSTWGGHFQCSITGISCNSNLMIGYNIWQFPVAPTKTQRFTKNNQYIVFQHAICDSPASSSHCLLCVCSSVLKHCVFVSICYLYICIVI